MLTLGNGIVSDRIHIAAFWLPQTMKHVKLNEPNINGHSRILKWRYCTIFQAIFSGDIHLHWPKKYAYIGLTYGIGTSNKSDPEIPIDNMLMEWGPGSFCRNPS